jgi:hypothetical protein
MGIHLLVCLFPHFENKTKGLHHERQHRNLVLWCVQHHLLIKSLVLGGGASSLNNCKVTL